MENQNKKKNYFFHLQINCPIVIFFIGKQDKEKENNLKIQHTKIKILPNFQKTNKH